MLLKYLNEALYVGMESVTKASIARKKIKIMFEVFKNDNLSVSSLEHHSKTV